MRTKWLEMQGKTVNGFKILEVYRENKRTMAKVVCPACGKTFITRAEHIKNGKNCGCTTRIKMNDLTGKKFGRLTAIELIWKCVCDCGKISFVNSGSLTSGRIKSCGCLRKPHEIEFKGKHYYLGRYANKEDAREAREKAEKEMFGKFLEEHKEYVKDKKDKKN